MPKQVATSRPRKKDRDMVMHFSRMTPGNGLGILRQAVTNGCLPADSSRGMLPLLGQAWRASRTMPMPMPRALQHINANGNKVQQAAGKAEQVPDTVPVAIPRVVGKENNAHRIQHPPGGQPGKARAPQGGE